MTIILHNIAREIFDWPGALQISLFSVHLRLLFRTDKSSYNVCLSVRVNCDKVRPVSSVVLGFAKLAPVALPAVGQPGFRRMINSVE